MLSVVIPAYNEEAVIEGTIRSLTDILLPAFAEVEIIVVDDGSQDQTARKVGALTGEAVQGRTIRVVRNETNRGKGYSIKQGVLASSGDVIIFIDADLSYAAASILKIAQGVSAASPVLIGSRKLPSSEILAHVSLTRFFFGRAFSMLIRLLVLKDIADTQCGLKGFDARIAKKLFPLMRIDGFAFDVEFLFLAQKYHADIQIVPVNLVDNRRDSRVNMILDPIEMFIDLFKIRLNDWAGKYGKSVNP